MSTTQSTFILLIGIIFYIMLIDKNVEDYLMLVFKIIRVNFERYLWLIKFHPRNPITNFLKEMEYNKLAKEMMKEIENKNNDK